MDPLLLACVFLFGGIVYWFLVRKAPDTIRQTKTPTDESSTNSIHKQVTDESISEQSTESTCCGNEEEDEGCGGDCSCKPSEKKPVKILYATQTGTAKEWAERLAQESKKRGFAPTIQSLSDYDPDDLTEEKLVLFVVATYTDGTPPEPCVPFFTWLKDMSLDFRVSRDAYEGIRYAVFGIGHNIYGKNFNRVGKDLDRMLRRLSAKRVIPVGLGDNGASVEVIEAFSKWNEHLWNALEKGNFGFQKSKPIKRSNEVEDGESDEEQAEPLADLEDLGPMMKKTLIKPKTVIEEEDEDSSADESENPEDFGKEMLTPSLRTALTKQGYKLLGSHSGVKICRWTKAMLRGRGGCYKHTFYGITSYQCMEMTPSLACANKCVFCWRHHKNPVGREWRWKADPPDMLIDTAIQNHRQMIKQLKGVPGIVPERWEEAFTVKHCALSLVGEPIIYPYINEFVDLLHEKQISSFLVTNAQFPDKIDAIKPVTQLYVSVDAATKESLKAVDRPIFSDFWERFLASLDSLSRKGQRTVYRMTLIKGWNVEELLNYAQLIERGNPTFIEIKGVTYCGSSKASTLTMKNVPFHEEVLKFAEEMCQATPFLAENYEIACEHEHSCCILIANKKFKVDGQWQTWIDYPKFHELIQSGKPFDAFDYTAPTPNWAVVNSVERGFDPEETRLATVRPYQKAGC